jgi:hypothetical protein
MREMTDNTVGVRDRINGDMLYGLTTRLVEARIVGSATIPEAPIDPIREIVRKMPVDDVRAELRLALPDQVEQIRAKRLYCPTTVTREEYGDTLVDKLVRVSLSQQQVTPSMAV